MRAAALVILASLAACGSGASEKSDTAGGAGGTEPGTTGGAAAAGAADAATGAIVTQDASATPDAGASGDAGEPDVGGDLVREVPGFAGRPYILHPPGGAIPPTPTPVVIVFHGGGGNADGVIRMSCPGGALASAGCIDRVADREGFALVIPNGTGTLIAPNTRTWNAGGGEGAWQCVSGAACMRGIDDVAYFDALLADLATVLAVDERRVYLTGISNGAAMSHRLACERANRVAAIAPVAGGNQLTTTKPCEPARPVSVLAIHGTADPCWAFDGGPGACLQTDDKDKIDIPRTMREWAERNGCGATPLVSDLPDTEPDDGTTTRQEDYSGCATGIAVRLWRIEDGGHTWPDGFQYLPAATIGPTTRDFRANDVMWDFFRAHPNP